MGHKKSQAAVPAQESAFQTFHPVCVILSYCFDTLLWFVDRRSRLADSPILFIIF